MSVTGSNDKTIRFTTLPGLKFDLLTGHTAPVLALLKLPSTHIHASHETHAHIITSTIIRAHTHALSHTQTHTYLMYTLWCWVCTDNRIASGSYDKSIRIWSTRTLKVELILTGHNDAVCGLALLDDGRLLSCSHDKSMKVWSINTDKVVEKEKQGVLASFFSKHTNSSDKSNSSSEPADIHNPVLNARCEHTISNAHTQAVQSVLILPDARFASSSHGMHLSLIHI